MRALVMVLALLCMGALVSDAAKEKSEKERIVVLEKQVEALNETVSTQAVDLAGEHMWADEVNQAVQILNARTLELHEQVLKLETRGPVAEVR